MYRHSSIVMQQMQKKQEINYFVEVSMQKNKGEKSQFFPRQKKCPGNLLLCASDYVDFGNSLLCEGTN